MGEHTETVVDANGRVLIPRQLREELGLDEGVVVEMHKENGTIVMTPARKRHLSWKDLNGIKPKRTGKAEWPTPEQIKRIWEWTQPSSLSPPRLQDPGNGWAI